MGGLLSSNNTYANYENASVFTSRQISSSIAPYRTSSSRYDHNQASIRAINLTYSEDYSDDLFSFENLCDGRVTNDLPSEKIEQITRCPMFKNYPTTDIVSYTTVTPDSVDYHLIRRLIKNKLIKIDQILQVNNEFLEKSYQLKKEEKIHRFGYGVREHLLFHGTSLVNARKICKNNFDWRLCNRHKFGKGVNFSSSAKYASDSIKKNNSKVLIVAKVLIFKSHEGDPSTNLPQDGYDTTGKNDYDAIVQVKYEDAEFYPAYLIYYHMKIPSGV